VRERVTFTARRLLLTVPVMLAMSIFVFLMIRLVPGDPVRTMLGVNATPDRIAAIHHELGLDRPLYDQYISWLGAALHGDLGEDFISHQPMTQLLAQRLPVTLELTILSMAFALGVGIPLGVSAAVGRRWIRVAAQVVVIAGVTIPAFWLGIMLVLIFTGSLHLLPPAGYVPFAEDPLDNLRYMLLPGITLGAAELAYITSSTQASILDVLDRPFITFLRAKGLTERRIVFRHALRNAAIPIVTVTGIQFGGLLGGAIIIETLFALPGLGALVVTAINQRNYPVVQGSVLVIAVIFIAVNLLTDLIYGVLDPRAGSLEDRQ
jgi:peptide/nickel transport system permease protein